jgi:outer membrane protein TolC
MLSRDTMDVCRSRSRISPRMSPSRPNRQVGHGTALVILLALAARAGAQISLGTAVDLALRSNPRVQAAQADVDKAQAQLAETHAAYVPAVTAGAGIGQAYGYLPNPPTLFTVTAGSLVYNASQIFYVRSARAGLDAARLALEDIRETVAQDTALAFVALDHDQQHQLVVGQQVGYANSLITIVQERIDAGQDTQIGLTQAKLSAAQLNLGYLRAQDDAANEREHLARLIGVPSDSLRVDGSFPTAPVPREAPSASAQTYANAGVASAFASATARQQQAAGDARFRFWPQINLVAQYNRYATFTNSFKTLEAFSQNGAKIGSDEAAFGVQISLPFYDRARADKARESAADASKALHDAQNAQIDALDGQSRTRYAISELQAQTEVAALQQQLAQQQLDVLRLQLQTGTGNPNGPQMTPKDEQNARIAEREKYLGVIDASFQLRQAEIRLLRELGELETWLKPTASSGAQNNPPSSPTPQP